MVLLTGSFLAAASVVPVVPVVLDDIVAVKIAEMMGKLWEFKKKREKRETTLIILK